MFLLQGIWSGYPVSAHRSSVVGSRQRQIDVRKKIDIHPGGPPKLCTEFSRGYLGAQTKVQPEYNAHECQSHLIIMSGKPRKIATERCAYISGREGVCLYVCSVCVHGYIWLYIYIGVECMYECICVYMSVWLNMLMYMFMYNFMCIYLCVFVFMSVCVWVYLFIYGWMYMCKHMCMCSMYVHM